MLVRKRSKPSPTTQSCSQYISAFTSVNNMVVTDRTMWLVQFWENISKLYQRSAKVKLERNTWMSVLCWTSLCYDLRLQNLANDAFPRDIELVDHRIMLSAVTKGFRHLLTWPFSRSELFLEICVQICSNLNSHLEGSAIRAIKYDLHF